MKKRVKKRFITLIEIMIVMFLIAMITGAVAYNYRGSLDEGRAFKTQQGIEKIRTILLLSLADRDERWADVESNWEEYVKGSPLASGSQNINKDGWGGQYNVRVIEVEGGKDLHVSSEKYDRYLITHPSSITGGG